MIFPLAGQMPRHPSQLYEFALEGVLLFALLWWFSARPRPRGAVSAAFLIGYGAFRFAVRIHARARFVPGPAGAPISPWVQWLSARWSSQESR
jgi:prolipoprotein diacylglyceryltransferase